MTTKKMSEARRADFHHIHDAWIEATNVYLAVILISIGLFLYVKKHFKRPMIRVFPSSGQDSVSAVDRRKRADDDFKNVRLRQQLEHWYIARKWEQGQERSASLEKSSTVPPSTVVSIEDR
ncbi:PREDICTED: small integral membrane protein 19-like [Branchiostoma belcheri]|uniref:Small integral membrane protein 19 n=1 Tax=Branchiostoma belcheri TaxID=7741 RepID=A0A6P4ZQ84_BRABE|nr:PREDICTED: small integral membrane protein 19-like [Branchiostoma belcheri]